MKRRAVLMILAIFLALLVSVASAIETRIVDLASSGSYADGTVTITRDESGNMVFRDAVYGSTTTLSDLVGGGVTDHGALMGLGDDDHPQYYNAERLNTKFGASASTTTTGDAWTSTIAVPADPAGNTELGAHVQDTTIHWPRPPRVVTVGPTVGSKRGEYTSIRAAYDAVAGLATASAPYVILIYPGSYYETVTVSSDYISFVGVSRNSVRWGNGPYGALQINAGHPGVFTNITFTGNDGEADYAVVMDASNVSRFYNCRFETSWWNSYRRTSAGTVYFYNCEWAESGTVGIQTHSLVFAHAASAYLYNAWLDTTKSDHVFFYVPSGSGCVIAHIYGLNVNDGLVQAEGIHGLFLLCSDWGSYIYLHDANFATYGVVIHPDSTGGTIYYGEIQTNYWGYGSTGLTTSPLPLTGPQFTTPPDFYAGATAGGGTPFLGSDRQVWATTISATALLGLSSITADVGTFQITTATILTRTPRVLLTTASETQETDGLFSHIQTTSSGLVLDIDAGNNYSSDWKYLWFRSGDRSRPNWVWLMNGDSSYLKFLRSSDGFDYMRLYVSSGGPSLGYSGNNYTTWRYDGEIWNRLYSTDGSDWFRVRNSSNNDVWAVSSNGTVAMAQDGKLTIPDGEDHAPYVLSLGATQLYDSISTGSSVDAGGFVTWSQDGADLYFRFPVPAYHQGGTVVVDRITIYNAAFDSGQYLNWIGVEYVETDGSLGWAVRHSTIGSGTSAQFVESDFTVYDDRFYRIHADCHYSSGNPKIYGFKIEYHLE